MKRGFKMNYRQDHPAWIYVRCASVNAATAFDRLYDLIDEAAGHGFLVRGTSFDHCSGNTLKDRNGLRAMLDAVENNLVEAVIVRDLEQISRNNYLLVGVIEIFRRRDVYLITTECPQIAAQCSIQTKSVERVFRGERTTLKTAQEIAAALKCKPEKLFHIELDHRPIARKTIKEYAIFLRLVMQYAEREYGIDNDTQTLAVKGTRSRPVDCLHPEEVEALFKVLPRCSTLEQVIVMGLLNTGMRRGELAGLTWEDIDFDHCTVHVDKSLLIVNKGYHLTTTKEDNVRDIDVAPEFMEYLKTYREQWLAQKHRMGSAWQTCMDGKWESYRESLQKLRGKNFIVINDFGWPISPDHYGKIVDRVAEKAGIRKIHPHMFRHTFVSILLSNPDIGVATVAAEAGHAQPSTTLAIYTQVYHKRQDSIRNQMSETLYKNKNPER